MGKSKGKKSKSSDDPGWKHWQKIDEGNIQKTKGDYGDDGNFVEDDKTKDRDSMCNDICRCLYAKALLFNLVKDPFLKSMLQSVAEYEKRLIPHSYHEARVTFLENEVKSIQEIIERYRDEWKMTGCTLMSDGWTYNMNHSITNFLVNSPKGTVFLTSIDTSDVFKNATELFKLLDKHAWVLNLMRKFTRHKELTIPAVTRFATSYLTLRRLHGSKMALTAMYGSEIWQKSSYAKKADGQAIGEIILADKNFWSAIQYCLMCTLPLVKVLRLVDGDSKPAMGYIYEVMGHAKEQIKKFFKDVKKMYEPIWEIIDLRWDLQLHRPLHAAAYYLNPSFHYSPDFEVDYGIKNGLYKTIERMCPTPELREQIDRQLETFHRAKLMFGMSTPLYGGDLMEMLAENFRNLPFVFLANHIVPRDAREIGAYLIKYEVHTKRRNRLEQKRLNALVYTKYNLRLEARHQKRVKDGEFYDPISLSDMESDNEWITEREDPTLPENTYWLDINKCFQLENGESSKRKKRGRRDINKKKEKKKPLKRNKKK
ncbi:PREDICTED: uncharacterized protein LOC105967965 [Erythranthe guttata]|uniref:uncharacterized protein LOC105967965 n=1 Tax=Erythranthe guttata TaxID=4155 RepID=UPI00064D8984|nr:PREDICTED: uncharacterized protein LOC105967965 [Erythranthe guttata]|eukprot:XP_012848004.1 PREDICTED: uncharacterized protein LOC105967965 [Erythranthe guttata]